MPDQFSLLPDWLRSVLNNAAPRPDLPSILAAYGGAQLSPAPDLSGVMSQLSSLAAGPPAADRQSLSLKPWQGGTDSSADGNSLIGSQGPAAPYAWSSDNGQIVYIQRPDGNLEVRSGGTLTWRNNNQGDIASSSSEIGQNQSTQGRHFSIFDSPGAGNAAQQSLLFGPNYVNRTISDAITHYAPPLQNNTPAYITYVTGQTGLSPDTVLNSLDDQQRSNFMGAIRRYEGLTPGTVNTYIYNPFGN